MKVLKIFLRLKMQEVWKFIKVSTPYALLFIFFIGLFAFVAYSEKNMPQCYRVIVTILTIFCIIAGFMIAAGAVFCFIDWIQDNWRKAKRIAEQEVK